MPVPALMAQVNKRVFNPMEVKRGKRPVLSHVGRISGKTYHTPLDAHEVDGGYVFILMYGSDSDWVQNVLVADQASLRVNGDQMLLDSPRLMSKEEAVLVLSPDTKLPADFLRVDEYLRMDLV